MCYWRREGEEPNRDIENDKCIICENVECPTKKQVGLACIVAFIGSTAIIVVLVLLKG